MRCFTGSQCSERISEEVDVCLLQGKIILAKVLTDQVIIGFVPEENNIFKSSV